MLRHGLVKHVLLVQDLLLKLLLLSQLVILMFGDRLHVLHHLLRQEG